jgi:hypothetical protein
VSGHEWAPAAGAAGQLGLQARAAATLTGILERAAGEGLPPIAWTVQRMDAAVVGRCHAAGRHERREEFTAWREAISRWAGQAADVERHTDSLGTVRLRARWEGYERVHVTVAADIEAADEL